MWLSIAEENAEHFVKTRAAAEAKRILDSGGCIFIVGNPGDGKTSLGKYLLSEYSDHGYTPYLIHSPDEWRYCWDPRQQQLFMVDDAFGTYHPMQSNVDSWLSLHAEFELSLANAKYVFISTKHIYRSCMDQAGKRKVKFLENVLDLRSPDFCINGDEKVEIINSHCAKRGVKLDPLAVEAISSLSASAIGFPECCRLFTSDEKLREQKDPLAFFTEPDESINEQLQIFQTSPDNSLRYAYSLLVLTMLHDGKIPLAKFARDRDTIFTSQVHEILELMGLPDEGAFTRLLEAKNSVQETFLTLEDSSGCLVFCHESTQAVLALDFGHRHTKCFLRWGALSLISKHVQTKATEKNMKDVIGLDSSLEVELFRCLWRHISRGEIEAVFQHPSFSSESFQAAFLQSIFSEAGEGLEYERTRFGSDKSLLFVAVAYGTKTFVEHYLSYCKTLFEEKQESLLPLEIDTINSTFSVNWPEGKSEGRHCVTLAIVAAYFNRIKILKYLEIIGCNIFAKDEMGKGPLHYASYKGHTEVAQFLLKRGSYTSGRDGETPLHSASSQGHTGVVQLLLQNHATSEESMNNGTTALHIAGSAGYLGVVRILLGNRTEVNAKQSEGYTALHAAAQEGHAEIAQVLIEAGAEVNAKSNDESTALHLSANNGHEDVVKVLLGFEAEVTCKNHGNYSPLHLAASKGHEAVVDVLLSTNTDPDCIFDNGRSLLHTACYAGNLAVARILLEHGADVALKDSNGNTPAHVAAEQGSVEVLTLLRERGGYLHERNNVERIPLHFAALMDHLDAVQLLASEEFLNARDFYGETPLHMATKEAHQSVMELLLNKGADISAKDANGKTPMIYGSEAGNVQLVSLLSTYGASLTETDGEGRTPMHAAAYAGHVSLVQFFLNHGVDINFADNDGYTPIRAAAKNGHTDVVQLLI